MRPALVLLLVFAPPAFAVDYDAEAAAAFAFAKAARERVKPAAAAAVVAPAPVRLTPNCGAGFCKANGGTGCPDCPVGSGRCSCGTVQAPAAVEAPPVTYALPFAAQSCPNGQCGNAVEGRRGLFGWRR
jgi:hypothetical protein